MNSTQVIFTNNANIFGFLAIVFFVVEILVFIVVLVYRGRKQKFRQESSSSGDMTLWNLHLIGFAVKLAAIFLIIVWFFSGYQQVDPKVCTAIQVDLCDKVLIMRGFVIFMALLIGAVVLAVAGELVLMKKMLGYNKKTSKDE